MRPDEFWTEQDRADYREHLSRPVRLISGEFRTRQQYEMWHAASQADWYPWLVEGGRPSFNWADYLKVPAWGVEPHDLLMARDYPDLFRPWATPLAMVPVVSLTPGAASTRIWYACGAGFVDMRNFCHPTTRLATVVRKTSRRYSQLLP